MDILKTFFINHKKIIGLVLLLIIIAGFIGWKVLGKPKQAQYQTVKVERGMIISSVSASGQVLSVNILSANTKASGIVKTVYAKDGNVVKKGDKILEIALDFQGQQKNAQAWSSYLSAKNSLESAKATLYSLQSDMFTKWDTFKKLAESDTYKDTNSANRTLPEFYIGQDNWLSTEAKYKNQQAVITQAQASVNSSWLDYILTSPAITAPADGVITSLMYAEGMSIGSLDTGTSTSNQKVATIKSEGTPIVSVNLSEIDVSQVELGKKVTVKLDSISDKTFTGQVIGVDRIGQTSSGVTQYPAIIKLDSSANQILPNMTVTANIVIDRKDNVLLVPSTAIQKQGNQIAVRLIKGKQQQTVSVETGLVSDTQTEILSGLSEGDEVIIVNLTSNGNQSEGGSVFGSRGFGGGAGKMFGH